jgi:VIT1/CCC1 family predicted Fe2+/Mn2+ transporter
MAIVYHTHHTHNEPHSATDAGSRLNWLRAAVLGANDGIVSVASIVVGVAGASNNSPSFIFTAGVAGLVAGALSMAAGEYVSVSTQRDTEKALLAKERWELDNLPEDELNELTSIYEKKGLTKATARTVAVELTAHDAFAAHIDAELHINPDDLTNPWYAAIASALSFFAGAIIPLIAILLPPASLRIPITFVAVAVALAITGSLSAYVGGAKKMKATIRVILGGAVAMAITYTIGKVFRVAGV